MAVKFCFVSGATRVSLTCGMDTTSESADVSLFRLSEMGRPKYNTYTPEFIRKRVEVAQSLPDDTRNIWRNRIICTLAAVESVFCISFIPKDPSQLQILQVMRMKDVNETADSYQVYWVDLVAYKFLLPQDKVDGFFDLSTCSISQSVEKIELLPVPLEEVIYLIKDTRLSGLALTLGVNDQAKKTYIWLK